MNTKRRRGKSKSIKENIIEFVVTGVIAFAILKVFLIFVQHGEVQGASMEPTFHDKDFVIYYKLNSEYQKNDIVVFKYNNRMDEYYTDLFIDNNMNYYDNYLLNDFHIKRIVGVPGDNIKINSGNLYVNDVLISSTTLVVPNQQYTLNTNEYFVVGDNENNSFDSRHHGPVLLNEIEGNVITNK